MVHQGGSVHTVHDVDEAKLRLQREFVDQVVVFTVRVVSYVAILSVLSRLSTKQIE